MALVGPTGAGKSRVALAAASALRDRGVAAEIVAVDAFTVYRGMDVGTAKPPPADRAAVPHHMVDVLDVEQECTVAWFQAEARAAVARIHAAGRAALLVGGSGLYFRSVVDALEFPPTDADVRARIAAEVHADPAEAHARLAAADPEAAGLIEPGNARRTIRALEVIAVSGRPFSSYRTAWHDHTSIYRDLVVVGITHDRDTLQERIRTRTDAMLAAGWLAEVRALQGRTLSATAAQAIGYAELAAHLRGELDLEAAREQIVMRTRRFAARQRRWFRKDPRVQWSTTHDAREVLRAALRTRPGEERTPF